MRYAIVLLLCLVFVYECYADEDLDLLNALLKEERQVEELKEERKALKDQLIERSRANDIVKTGRFYYNKDGGVDSYTNGKMTHVPESYARRKDTYFYNAGWGNKWHVTKTVWQKLPRKVKEKFE